MSPLDLASNPVVSVENRVWCAIIERDGNPLWEKRDPKPASRNQSQFRSDHLMAIDRALCACAPATAERAEKAVHIINLNARDRTRDPLM